MFNLFNVAVMKVYKCKTNDIHSDGIVIVAANSPKEAKQAISQYIFWENLYSESDFKEIPNLEYKGNKPEVITELHYFD